MRLVPVADATGYMIPPLSGLCFTIAERLRGHSPTPLWSFFTPFIGGCLMLRTYVFTVLLSLIAATAQAGIYSGPTQTSHPIDAAIPSNSPLFTEWADEIDAARTYFAPRGATTISPTGFNSLGDLDATQIAAGDQVGYLTVTFPTGVRNAAGADFAI